MTKRLGKASREVLDLIDLNPNITLENISDVLNISVATARRRIRRLIRSGAISQPLMVSPEFSSFSAKALISMTTANKDLRRNKKPGYSNLKQFTYFLKSELPKTQEWTEFFASGRSGSIVVRGAYSVAGAGLGTDIVVILEGTSERLVRDFVTEVLPRFKGVVETNTAAIVNTGNT